MSFVLHWLRRRKTQWELLVVKSNSFLTPTWNIHTYICYNYLKTSTSYAFVIAQTFQWVKFWRLILICSCWEYRIQCGISVGLRNRQPNRRTATLSRDVFQASRHLHSPRNERCSASFHTSGVCLLLIIEKKQILCFIKGVIIIW